MGLQYVSEANKLRNIQKKLESSDILCNYIKCSGDNLRIQDFLLTLEKNRKFECETRQQEIKNILSFLKDKEQLLSDNIKTIDVKVFRTRMVHILDEIQRFLTKTRISLAITQTKEKEIANEVQVYIDKMKEWSEPIKYTVKFDSKIKVQIAPSPGINKEVTNFIDFVTESGGHENGWTEYDHRLFLKTRIKYRSIEKLTKVLKKLLPDLTDEDIKKHELWYRKYLELKKKKQEALEEWKRTKSNNQKRKIIKKEPKIPSWKTKSETINSLMRKKIKKWKEEREAEKEKCEKLKREEEKRLKEKDIKQEKINEQVKQRVSIWKETQNLLKEAEDLKKQIQMLKEQHIKSIIANKLIKEYQTRDDYYILKLKQQNKKKEQPKVPRSFSCTNSVVRDPKRLLKPTKQWLQRTAANQQDHKNVVCDIRNVQKLKKPDWRKGQF